MDYVATDSLNGNKWFYSDGWYYQKSGDVVVSRLSAKNFPDPFDVWDKKVAATSRVVSRDLTTQEREALKPRKYVFDIWEHRNANLNNEL